MECIKRIRLFVLLITVFTSCTQKQVYGNSALAEKLPLVQTDNKYINDTIKVEGKLYVELENVSVVTDNGSSIWINTFKPAVANDSLINTLNEKQVTIVGVYLAGKAGHLSNYSGKFTNVMYIKAK